MVHKMDSMSGKWRDDPVRAVLEKKQNREAAAGRLAQANAMASELLQKRLTAAGASSSARSRFDDADEDPTHMNDADYRQLLDRQRQKLMEDDASSSSSNISVYDPFMSKCVLVLMHTHSARSYATMRCRMLSLSGASLRFSLHAWAYRKARREEKAERKDKERKREKKEKKEKKHKHKEKKGAL